MTESISAEELAEQVVNWFYDGEPVEDSALETRITQAIKTATEPLEREIETLTKEIQNYDRNMLDYWKFRETEQKNAKLEAQNALLVDIIETWTWASHAEECPIGKEPSNTTKRCNCCEIAREALTNTTQAAKERDEKIYLDGYTDGCKETIAATEWESTKERIKVEGFNDCLRIYTEHMEQQGFSIGSEFIENVKKASQRRSP